MPKVEIIAIGNELLIGETLDTNTHWLCRQLSGLGAEVVRGVILPDKLMVIAEEITIACQTSIDLVITTGGLGPTDDDLTLAALAAALNLPLVKNDLAYQWIEEKYRELAAQAYVSDAEMTPTRTKMAMLPATASPLKNPVGAAPAVQINYQITTIVCLPGVPQELHAIVEQSLPSLFLQIFGVGSFQEQELWVACGDESVLAPILSQVVHQHPEVYIKSKAKGFGREQKFKIILHAKGEREKMFINLENARVALQTALKAAGIALLHEQEN